MPINSSILISLLTTLTVSAAADDFRVAIHYYKSKHYAQASKILEKLVGKEYSNSAKAHYYYANCLLKTNRKEEALHQYARVMQLEPNSLVAAYSSRVLRFNHSYVKDDSHFQPVRKVAKANIQPSLSPKLVSREIKNKMAIPPELVTNYRVGITLAEFRRTGNKNHFLCEEHYRAARRANQKALENLNKVRLMVSGMVPSQRKRGETEEDLKERQKIYKKEVEKILKPYEDNFKETEDWMLEKEAIMRNELVKRSP